MTPHFSLPDLANLVPNPDWASLPLFDRSGWRRVRFGEVVKQLKEEVDPRSGEVERYVAGEHMQTENVHIREWGTIGDDYLGPAFIRRFRRGQVLYGSRRTYLKKVAAAEWDGVTANTTFVMEAVEGRLLQKLLPWLMLSERFTKHSVQESKGSTNPYINFPDIAKFEFDLPPLEQQRRFAEIMLAMDEVEEKLEAEHQSCEAMIAAKREVIARSSAARQPIKAISKLVTKGESPSWQGFVYQEEGPLFVTSENVLFGHYSPEPRKYIPEAFHKKLRRSALQGGDVLFNIVGASIGRGCVFPNLDCEANTNQAVAVIRVIETHVLPEYVLGFMLSPSGLKSILGTSVNTARANLSLEGIRNIRVPVEPLEFQRRQIEKIQQTEIAAAHVAEAKGRMRAFRNAILNQIFTS